MSNGQTDQKVVGARLTAQISSPPDGSTVTPNVTVVDGTVSDEGATIHVYLMDDNGNTFTVITPTDVPPGSDWAFVLPGNPSGATDYILVIEATNSSGVTVSDQIHVSY
jgi:hypothetical protein